MPPKDKQEQVKEFIDAIGAISEMSLIFYRSSLLAGATPDEAIRLTQAYIAAILRRSSDQKSS